MPPGLTPHEALASEWDFSEARFDLDDDLVAIGADLAPGTLIHAYSQGVFPMGLGDGGAGPIGWWSPLERGVLERDALRVSRSLRKSRSKFEVTVDKAFQDVVAACADPGREGAWITRPVAQAYTRLHELSVAHSVEVWRGGDLVGGLYGVSIGGLFAGESMFHHVTDASKVALCALSDIVFASPAPRLIDTQWATEHLRSLGVTEQPRDEYRCRLDELVRAPAIDWAAIPAR